MKKVRHETKRLWRVRFFLPALFGLLSFDSAGQDASDGEPKRCATMEAYYFGQQKSGRTEDPLKVANEKISAFVEARRRLRTAETGVIRIPVVVHVIHNRESGEIGGRGNPNITEEQILSQIRILNEDYRRMPGTPGYNANPAGVDTGIEFFLAEEDPEGSLTDGITRHFYTEKNQFNPYSDAQVLAEIVSWPTDRYLNIWVCALAGNYLGVAQFPSLTGIPGLDNTDAAKELTDGVIIDYRSFGDVGAIENSNYNQGRTTTHEVGHWLGLLHIWGDSRCGNDYCDDTPWAETSNSTSCNDLFSSCFGSNTRNMIENYMDYSPDRCMNVFTFNQMERMHAVLELSPRRRRLVENAGKARLEENDRLLVKIYPNPIAERRLQVEVRFKGYQDVKLAIYDMQGRLITSADYEKVWSRLFKQSVHTFTPGVYLLVVINEQKEKVIRRFVVN